MERTRGTARSGEGLTAASVERTRGTTRSAGALRCASVDKGRHAARSAGALRSASIDTERETSRRVEALASACMSKKCCTARRVGALQFVDVARRLHTSRGVGALLSACMERTRGTAINAGDLPSASIEDERNSAKSAGPCLFRAWKMTLRKQCCRSFGKPVGSLVCLSHMYFFSFTVDVSNRFSARLENRAICKIQGLQEFQSVLCHAVSVGCLVGSILCLRIMTPCSLLLANSLFLGFSGLLCCPSSCD